MTPLEIQMLGEFSLSSGSELISDRENRSHKIWALLAYLIYHRHRTIPQAELLELLWGESSQGSNPIGALKTTFHRVRTTLDRLWPSAGHQLILNRDGGYIWNPEIPVCLDFDEFDRLCRTTAEDQDERLAQLLAALDLYKGDFLTRQPAETWILPISAYYHNLYVHALMEVLPLLFQQQRLQEVVDLCRTASSLEPYHEPIHCYLMRALMALGNHADAISVYKELSDRLYANFGVLPADETRTIYREATRTINDHAVIIDTILEQLEEKDAPPGALICEYDFFRVLCRSVSRSMSRTGIASHIVLLSLTGKTGTALAARSLHRAMDNLEEQIRINLRTGDSAARCSASQFVLMLPQANYENSDMVCNRIIKAFVRQYPHSPAVIEYAIHPLLPIS